MSLSGRQREDLHRSMLSYLKKQNLTSSYKVLSKELSIDDSNDPEESKYNGLLEKKWLSVIRLQKKIMDLEQALAELQAAAPTYLAQTNGRVDLTSWTPRAPAKHSLRGHQQPITGIAFHPTFSIIATSSEDSSIKIWDWETGDFERTLKSHTKSVTDVDFAPPSLAVSSNLLQSKKSMLLASCSSDLTIKLWDADDEYKCIRTLYGHDHVISAVKFIPVSGDQLASVGRDRTIRIWQVSSGYCMKTIDNAHGDWIRCLVPSFDGLALLTAGSDHIARYHIMSTGECKMDLRGHEHVVECATLAPPQAHEYLCKMAGTKASKSSLFAATGSRDKSIKLWNVETGICIATLNGHDNWVRALVFHPDGKYLLSSSDDKSIKIWDLEQGPRCSRTIEDAHGHFVSCMRWGLSTSQIVEQRRRKGEVTNGTQQEDLGKGRYVLASAGVDQTIKIWLP